MRTHAWAANGDMHAVWFVDCLGAHAQGLVGERVCHALIYTRACLLRCLLQSGHFAIVFLYNFPPAQLGWYLMMRILVKLFGKWYVHLLFGKTSHSVFMTLYCYVSPFEGWLDAAMFTVVAYSCGCIGTYERIHGDTLEVRVVDVHAQRHCG